MPEQLPAGVTALIIVLQLLIAGALIVLLVKLRRAVKAQGLSMVPRGLGAKLKSLLGPRGPKK